MNVKTMFNTARLLIKDLHENSDDFRLEELNTNLHKIVISFTVPRKTPLGLGMAAINTERLYKEITFDADEEITEMTVYKNT